MKELEENITPANIGGMGEISLPTETETGSGDVPSGLKKKKNKKLKKMFKSFENYVSHLKENDSNDVEIETTAMLLEAKRAGLSKKETLKVAQKFADALTKLDGKKYTVSSDYEEDSFDLDIDGDEYAGGSYNINDDGSVVNMATWNRKTNVSPTYGNMDDDIKTIIKTIKNLKESVTNEQMDLEDELANDEFGMDFDKLGSKEKNWVRDEMENIKVAESVINEAKFKKGQYIKAKSDSDDFDGDVYDKTNDVDGSEILKNSSFEIYEIGKDEVILWSDADEVEYSIDPDDLKNFVKESVITEAKSIKVTKKEWPYVEFKIGSTKHKVEFDYEDIIDDHGNEGQDQFWLGKDDDGKEWSIDVYADYNGDVQDVHYDTIVAESVINEANGQTIKEFADLLALLLDEDSGLDIERAIIEMDPKKARVLQKQISTLYKKLFDLTNAGFNLREDNSTVNEARPGTETYYQGRDVLPPYYGNSQLHDKSEEMFKKSWKRLNDKQKDEVLSSFPKNESVVTEAIRFNASDYIKAGKLGYNDQFLGKNSLARTLSIDLGLNATDEYVGPWLGFDHVSLYAIGKKGGTILKDALTDKYTYEELKKAAADFMGIKESVVTEAKSEAPDSLLKFMNDEQDEGQDANVHLATFDGSSMEAQSTTKTWEDGVPVTKYFTRGGYKPVSPKGEIWILESERFWYFRYKGVWYAVKIADYGTPPFEY